MTRSELYFTYHAAILFLESFNPEYFTYQIEDTKLNYLTDTINIMRLLTIQSMNDVLDAKRTLRAA
jgi:hypothetical protein